MLFGDGSLWEVIRLDDVMRWGPDDDISILVKEEIFPPLPRHTQRKGHVSTWQDGSHLEAKRRDLRMKTTLQIS